MCYLERQSPVNGQLNSSVNSKFQLRTVNPKLTVTQCNIFITNIKRDITWCCYIGNIYFISILTWSYSTYIYIVFITRIKRPIDWAPNCFPKVNKNTCSITMMSKINPSEECVPDWSWNRRKHERNFIQRRHVKHLNNT